MSREGGASGESVAARQAALAARARAYLDGPWRLLPAGRRLGPRLGGAVVLVVGAQALGAAGARTPLEVEILLGGQDWASWRAQARASEFLVADPVAGASVRIRDEEWLVDRLAAPGGLWLRQRAVVVADPGERFATAVRTALTACRRDQASAVRQAYRALRAGLASADTVPDSLARRVLLGRAVEAALTLPVLCRAEPCPPPEWLGWYLVRISAEGAGIAELCARVAAGTTVDGEAAAQLRRVIDELLDAAGFGEGIVRGYGQWA